SEITTWREWERLLMMVNHIVVTRPGYEVNDPIGLRDRIVDVRSKTDFEVESDATRIYLTDIVMRDVSATRIRGLANEGQMNELAQLVSAPVAEYIRKYALYRESNEA